MANYLAPQFKGLHLEEEMKMKITKQDIEDVVNILNNREPSENDNDQEDAVETQKMSVAHRFTWLFALQSLTELKACSPLALYHC